MPQIYLNMLASVAFGARVAAAKRIRSAARLGRPCCRARPGLSGYSNGTSSRELQEDARNAVGIHSDPGPSRFLSDPYSYYILGVLF